MIPFTPAGTVTVPVTTASSRVALPVTHNSQIMITNAGPSLAFIKFGDVTVAAAVASSVPLLPNAAYVFTVAPGQTHVAAIVGAATATLYATAGEGA